MTIDIFTDGVSTERSDRDQTPNIARKPTSAKWLRILVIAFIGYIAFTSLRKRPIPPAPNPIDAKGFRVLIVEETERRAELSQGQHLAMFSIDVRKWLDDNCAKDNDQPARLIIDSETDLRPYGETWVAMRQYATPPYPCIVVSNPPDVVRHDIRRDIDPQRLIEMLKPAKSKSRNTQPNNVPQGDQR